MIFHSAGFDPAGGIHVSDVWTSQEAFDQYFEKRLLPAMQKLKISPPKREIYPLHAALVGADVEQFKAKQLVR